MPLRIAGSRFFRYTAVMPSREKLSEFTTWCRKNITGDEKGQAQIFLDRLFIAFGPDFKLIHYRTTLTIDSSSRVWSMLTSVSTVAH